MRKRNRQCQPLHPQVLPLIEVSAWIWIYIYFCLQSLPKHPWLGGRSLVFQKHFSMTDFNICCRNMESLKLSWFKMKHEVSATFWQETIRDLVSLRGLWRHFSFVGSLKECKLCKNCGKPHSVHLLQTQAVFSSVRLWVESHLSCLAREVPCSAWERDLGWAGELRC